MDARISRLIDSLPTLTKYDVDIHDYCPICFVDFKTILNDSDSEPAGLTRLTGCNHVFCRKDLIHWIRSLHGSCPTCRNIFLSNLHPSESDDESDGGEYVPNEHDDYEDEYEDDEADFSFDDDPEDPEAFAEEDDEFGREEEFEEEDDRAMGLLTDDLEENGVDWIEATMARQEEYVEAQVQAAEATAARIEAELQDFDVEEDEEENEEYFGAGMEEAVLREEAEHSVEEEAGDCTRSSDQDIDSESLRLCFTDPFGPEAIYEVLDEGIHEEAGNEEGSVGVYEEFDQR